ncbi:MAG: serine/threonine protein kinase, partial [Candidatus Solibacter sp.]|nr:serine/threonine protein kinase [Candidatus Solibacter sp.]
MEFELGRTYSGYKFLDVVRRSRSLVQYRVQNTIAQRLENLQTLPAAAIDDQEASERFLREVRIRARLQHPHVVSFYTALPVEGRMVMTTELYDGLPLAERLQLGPLPWREAVRVATQVLEVLTCLHQQSFVHCDITPDNIQFGPDGFCKISNFGLTRPLGAAHAPDSGAVVGNPKYISPEQVKGARELDRRSDLYSLAVVLYEMLTGKPPFESRSQFELMLAHVNQTPATPSEANPAVPTFLDAVVLRGLAKEPVDRYPTAEDFSAALAAMEAPQKSDEVVASELMETVVETAPELVAEVAEPVVEDAPEVVAEVAESVVESAPEVVAEAVEAVVEVATEVVAEAAEAVVETAPEWVSEVAEPVVEVAPDVVAEIAEPVVEAAAEVVFVAEPVVEAATEVVSEIVEPVVDAALEAVAEGAEPVVEAAPEVVAEIAEPVVEAATEVVSEVVEPVVDAALEAVAEG